MIIHTHRFSIHFETDIRSFLHKIQHKPQGIVLFNSTGKSFFSRRLISKEKIDVIPTAQLDTQLIESHPVEIKNTFFPGSEKSRIYLPVFYIQRGIVNQNLIARSNPTFTQPVTSVISVRSSPA